MALIEVILNEYKRTDPDEVSLKVKGWIKRCNDEKVSLYALEKILALETNIEVSRSMSRYVSSLVEPNVTITQVSEEETKNDESSKDDDKGIINKIASIFKLKKKSK